ncbi:arabinosyltransferase [Rhodococcus sp. D2-41]|uniref:arabinosyltransferase domain-containing protein n=1 Tax=Speluncibacter jeojiensis TaxID=2710754 RepID=UPI00240FE177|nr:arabinosyltransferase domain-containing protein [Rhodococcus sp. D2-41]MDG3010428.1 arabinosyltransferase [Rhodococcus sp. D2-41]
MPTAVTDQTAAASAPGSSSPADVRTQVRTARLVAVVTGLLGFLMAVVTPILPVTQTTAQMTWPQNGSLNSVTAPLVSYEPIELNASIPCTAVTQLRDQHSTDATVLLSTAPKQAGDDALKRGLFVTAHDGIVEVRARNTQIVQAPESKVLAPGGCSALTISANADRVTATFEGLTGDDGKPISGTATGQDLRPQVVGVFTDLTGAAPAGLSFHANIDSRYSTTPTLFKGLAMIFGVLLTVISLVALARLDATDGRKHRRFLPARWWRFTVADGAVIGILLLWHFIGANTSDDGYILQMARTASHSGYMANYFRWYAAPEAPFGMPYYVFTWMAHVTTASPWMRLPALVAGVLSWLVISREVIPRLGRLARHRKVVVWTAAAVFLAFWLPYNNGLRPEPVIAAGALLTWCSIERAIATGRLLPAAAALLIAGFTLSAGPTGLICVAALIAGSRPLIQLLVRRGRQVGFWALIAPLLASGTLVLILVFGDESLKVVIQESKMKSDLGPSSPWYEEIQRYDALMSITPDGSVARRFAVAIMFLCLITCAAMLFRKRGIPGAAVGPARRIVGITALSIALMMFNPTKWTHHFGVFAGLAGALAALTALAVSAPALRSRRNRTLFAAAVLFVLALCFESSNGWWYVSSYGIPWGGAQPNYHGLKVGSVFLALTVLALLLALWFHYREPYTRETVAENPESVDDRTSRSRRIMGLAAAPLTIAAGMLVVFEVLSLAAGVVNQRHSYSVGMENFRSVIGKPCGMADFVQVETNPNAGMLAPTQATPDPLGAVEQTNFTPDGLPGDLTADQQATQPGVVGTGNNSNTTANSAGTGGGISTQPGVNGSHMLLPFGLDRATTPVLGSFQTGDQKPAKATSTWYALPPRNDDSPLLVVSAAGRVSPSNLQVEFSREVGGRYESLGVRSLIDIGPAPSWRNLRLPMTDVPAGAQAVRIVADEANPSPNEWIAFTPPRVPRMQTLQQLVGSTDPVLLDWAVGLAFPCQRPFDHLDGVAEIPKFRILPDRGLAVSSTNTWQDAQGGGPLGWAELLLQAQTVPSYLKGDYGRDWGSLESYTPLVPGTSQAQLQLGTATRWGMWTPGPIRH